ncbi:hypothetical protein OCK74_25130 [Chitinophagaceae bacterium LB-8]|uniref:Uncharacterized protein n=1 Tax=Paraflavisolibacter caeni TaxID=2982496 RepID=A0A9X3BJ70_9BACT|nr:hypothetical protein [Paraflavisolibacter caeni]MCU7552427.1 hypothetical protein [Paraflavisolibacter caeni]
MKHYLLLIVIVIFSPQNLKAQKDTTQKNNLNSDIDYDELFNELDGFLDSLTKPRNFTIVSIGIGNRVFNYKSASSAYLTPDKNLALSPSLGYFSKSGLGINAAAAIVKENKGLNAYQWSATASYDYLKNPGFLTGLSYTRFFTKDSLNFYTSPLQNEVYTYFSYRYTWLKPSISASYGWGSRTEVEKREDQIKLLKRLRNVDQISRVESIRDFNLNFSLRHDFYWLDVLVSDDFVRFTPQLSVTAGTQNYGFNQSITTNNNKKLMNGNRFFGPQNYSLDQTTKFQPLSLTAFLKSEFSKDKFFFQPQLMFDYYLPKAAQKFTTSFMISSGFLF